MTSSSNTSSTQLRYAVQACRAIESMLMLEHETQQMLLARMVAATLHDGTGSALKRFASTGELDTQAILDELDQVQVPFEQEAWVDALARFALFTDGGRS